jgi:hypothetical protein
MTGKLMKYFVKILFPTFFITHIYLDNSYNLLRSLI